MSNGADVVAERLARATHDSSILGHGSSLNPRERDGAGIVWRTWRVHAGESGGWRQRRNPKRPRLPLAHAARAAITRDRAAARRAPVQ